MAAVAEEYFILLVAFGRAPVKGIVAEHSIILLTVVLKTDGLSDNELLAAYNKLISERGPGP